MPAYPQSVYSIAPGDFVTVWNAETPTPGNGTTAASQQVALVAQGADNGRLHFHGQFSGAPGAFEVDCQVADVDSDTSYQTLANGSITTVDATNNTFHFEVVCTAKFARMLMRSRTNSVTITATIGC